MSVPLPFANRPVRVEFCATYVEGQGWSLHCTQRMPWERWDDSSPLVLRRLADNELPDAIHLVASNWLGDR